MSTRYFKFIALASILFFSCDSKTEMKEEVSTEVESNEKKSTSTIEPTTSTSEMHEVRVVEVLQAERYTYLKVVEKGNEFWIAALKLASAKVGETYLYQGGLLKTNFESQEHHKIFDKIYLVSEIINANAHPGNMQQADAVGHNHPISDHPSQNLQEIKGAIKVSELLGNAKRFAGKQVIVVGEIVKANYGIMNSNWYHLQDGSNFKGKKTDIVVTSKVELPQGETVGFKGKVVLNKDLGSGYFFEILIENAELP